ncbi:putative 4-alpha-glucanotransferase (malQ-like) [Bradyrhizobium sp. STM 3843]|uniref:4-alpha-glucanotransferase n=1 Tax=Bradyrhizobium sp. STM 3843 TaxID=551947 RepID=UPI000240AA24|nr:4-alpha-glucanotransferase [Bradyrhizobium sp. STM 3843]CCE05224.1 putative 4-alpha-glucanotransferase (malQ-like) [Bradyrhizobium sp. STM 3843]
MDLFSQAHSLGIMTEFFDGQGRRHVTEEAALKIIVESFPQPTPHRLLDGTVVIRTGQPARSRLGDAAKLPVSWTIRRGDEAVAVGKAEEPMIEWPDDLPVGSYRLQLIDASLCREELPLIVAPPKAFGGEFDRGWLLAVQLYGIRSGRNWGMGDFTDLADLIELGAELGADGVGLNPLHALFDDRPGDFSPYAPNSRLFLNALYIDVEQAPGFQGGIDASALESVRQTEQVNYKAVAALKWPALRAAFAAFSAGADAAHAAEFVAYRAERGELLERFCCFEVLRHRFKQPWWEWPEEWRQPDAARCRKLLLGSARKEADFVAYVQWLAERQLRACKELGHRLGMKVGLYLDVAVGVQSDGFDAWNEQGAISRSLSVGAPPDPLNTLGQNWGLAGFNAPGLELRSFEPFREMIRASMRHAGAIRLDHVLGLKRLYLVPHGFPARQGAYVQMPFDALLAATALESVANACVVIGEDLGTVPPGFREQMADWGIWSYKVMIFEREDNGHFRDLDYYQPNALVTLNTHDLSTYAGWRSFGDLNTKRALGIDPGETDEERWRALGMLDEVLRHNGIGQNDVHSAIGFLSRTRCRLLAVSLEDLLGVVDQPNIPGTIDEHPNWRQKVPIALEDIAGAVDVAALKAGTAERVSAAGMKQ